MSRLVPVARDPPRQVCGDKELLQNRGDACLGAAKNVGSLRFVGAGRLVGWPGQVLGCSRLVARLRPSVRRTGGSVRMASADVTKLGYAAGLWTCCESSLVDLSSLSWSHLT